MIKIKDISEYIVNINVLYKVEDIMDKTGIKEVDFKDTVLLDYTHEKIAEMITFKGLIPFNISNEDDRNKIEYFRLKLMQPDVDNINEFIEVFKKRFKVGSVCVLDRTIKKGLKVNENKRSIIMIEGYDKKRVYIRVYHSSKVQPKFFEEYGGKDSPQLFIRTEIMFTDLYNNEVIIDYPKNELERQVIDVLFNE